MNEKLLSISLLLFLATGLWLVFMADKPMIGYFCVFATFLIKLEDINLSVNQIRENKKHKANDKCP